MKVSAPHRGFLFLAGLVTAGLAFTGCGPKHQHPSNGETVSLPAATVRVQTVESRPRTATEEVVGTVRAKLRAVIEAKVTGRIEAMRVVPGQIVAAGDLLAQLDVREIQAQLDQARALYQQAEADLKRYTTLLDQRILSQAEFDAVQSRFRVAEAGYVEAQTLVGYAKVTAPFAGVITRKHADVGDLATPGKPLLEIEDARALRLEADVPEAVVGKLKLGDSLPVRIAAFEAELQGTVSEIAPAADPSSRTFLVKLDLPSTPGLRAGQFGRVAMPVGTAETLQVPASAVVRRGQMELVSVVADGRARLRLIKTGKRIGPDVEVVSGLSSGEQIVSDGPGVVMDGQPVTVSQ